MTIRVGRGTLSFSTINDEGEVLFEPYVVKSGVSMAANLREAFKTSDFLSQASGKARLMIDGNVLLTPVDMYNEENLTSYYEYAFSDCQSLALYNNVLPELNAVAVFGVNKDLRLVIDDHFSDVNTICAVSPVWRHLHQRSYTGPNQKLFAYFHEHRMEVFSFQQNRFKFANSFDIKHTRDAAFFLLYVWRQLQMHPRRDELHLVGDLFKGDSSTAIATHQEVLNELKKFLQKVYVINPTADFNRAPVTEIKGMPYDLQTLFVKGR